MRIRVVICGKVKQRFVLDGEAEYLKRLKPWAKVELEELQFSTKGSDAEIKAQQSSALLDDLKRGEYFVALDERGEEFTSQKFSKVLSSTIDSGRSNMVFAIGAAFGFDETVRKRADLILSLSQLTFPFQMSRLILIEQLYRAFSIMKGQPYHKI